MDPIPASFHLRKNSTKKTQLCHRGDPLCHHITQGEQRQLPMLFMRVEGNPRFGKQQCPYSNLQPFPACTRCPATGVSKRKLNRRRAVKCNVLAVPNQHGLCQDQLGTAVGQPKICYNPEPSGTGTPDTQVSDTGYGLGIQIQQMYNLCLERKARLCIPRNFIMQCLRE